MSRHDDADAAIAGDGAKPPANLQIEWARLLLSGFYAAGVRHVVISPGSRSTPFVLAAAEHGGLRCHDVIDERAAAFFALGAARATSAPALLLCTSGTAGAHYLPAVIEAAQSYVPLLVLTADRPFELQGCTAPQTVDQVKLFGDHARGFFELGLPDGTEGALRALQRIAAQAVYLAKNPLPGAVHVNARARKPLEPPRGEGPAEVALAARTRRIASSAPTRVFTPRALPDPEGVDEIARACAAARRGLIVCGPAPITQAAARQAVRALSAQSGFPLLAEATSQLRFSTVSPDDAPAVDAFDAILRSRRFGAAEAPDLILQLGAPPTSGAFAEYLAAHSGCARYVIAPWGWNDPRSDARGLLMADVGDSARVIAARLGELGTDRGDTDGAAWRARWSGANEAAWRTVDAVLALEAAECGLVESEIARAAARSVPEGGLLMVGNSLAVRELDLYTPAGAAACEVLSQRGASGIDGLVSGGAGASSCAGRPVTLLLGDVSLLHDIGGLYTARLTEQPFVIVVIQNAGGRIFEQLPVARAPIPASALAHFTTPHDLGFEHAAALYHIPYVRVDERGALDAALGAAQGRRGPTVIEAVVTPQGAARAAARLASELDAVLGAGLGPVGGGAEA